MGVAKAATYWNNDFANVASMSYYTQQQQIGGVWQGELARKMGLVGEVKQEHFERLVQGKHHETGEQLVSPRNGINQKTGKAVSRRAGHDIVFNWDKSISVTAVADPEIYAIERRAIGAGLKAMERYVQLRGGGNNEAITTREWIVAKFQHTTARPVDGYSAPHLHTHAFWINLGQDASGQYRAVQPHVMFEAQKLASATASAHMAYELRERGYNVQKGKNNAVTISGYSQEYLKAESPRSEQIKKTIANLGYSGRRAEEIVAHQYRDAKLTKPQSEILEDHKRLRAEYGDEWRQVVNEAKWRRDRGITLGDDTRWDAAKAVTWAKDHLAERQDVFQHRELVTHALWAGQNYVRLKDVEVEIARRTQTGVMYRQGVKAEFMLAPHATNQDGAGYKKAGTYYTTDQAKQDERAVLEMTRQARGVVEPLWKGTSLEDVKKKFAHLNDGRGLNADQAQAVHEQVTWGDRITGIVGGAGTGKTTAVVFPLKQVAELAADRGYQVIGLAPTGRARHELEAAGIRHTMTTQKFLHTSEACLERRGIDPYKPRLYIVDESTLQSTRSYKQFLERFVSEARTRPGDMLKEVGDPRQHESVEAGRIFEEQIESGMRVSRVDDIVRQRSPELRMVAQRFAEGRPHRALSRLEEIGTTKPELGGVEVIAKPAERIQRMAQWYVEKPQADTLLVSPDNESRRKLNTAIREELRSHGLLAADSARSYIYVNRQEMTAAMRQMASAYHVGDVLRYQQDSKGISRNEYATVVARNTDAGNQSITVQLHASGKQITYDPRTRYGVEVYERQERGWAVNDRVMLKKGWKGLENGDTMRIRSVDQDGSVEAVADKNGKVLRFNLKQNPHIEYGYASTSYSAEGSTVDRVGVHIDTSDKRAVMGITKAYGYVANTRGRDEIRVFTDDLARAKNLLQNSTEKLKALESEEIAEYRPGYRKTVQPEISVPAPAVRQRVSL